MHPPSLHPHPPCTRVRIAWAHPEFGSVVACASQHLVYIWHETDGVRLDAGSSPPAASSFSSPSAAAAASATAIVGAPWQCVAKLADSSQCIITDIAFSPSHHGLKLAAASADGAVRIYEAPDVLSLRTWHLSTTIAAGAMLIDGGSVLSISWCSSRFDPPMLACGACDFDCIVTGLCTVLPPKLISSFQAWHAYRAAPPRTPRLPPPLLMPRRTRQCTALRGRPTAGAPFTPWQRRVRTDACACTTFTHQRE